MFSPSPWRFQTRAYGLAHVVLDAEKRVIVAHVPIENGPLIAAAPTMYAVLQRVARGLPKGDPLGDLARRALATVDCGCAPTDW